MEMRKGGTCHIVRHVQEMVGTSMNFSRGKYSLPDSKSETKCSYLLISYDEGEIHRQNSSMSRDNALQASHFKGDISMTLSKNLLPSSYSYSYCPLLLQLSNSKIVASTFARRSRLTTK